MQISGVTKMKVRKMKTQIFISYRVKDSLEIAKQLSEYLTSKRYIVFLMKNQSGVDALI